jgi:hypothetical protein
MSKIKNALDEILNCNICYGQGYSGWASPEGDFDFDWCECNPHSLILEDGMVISE